MKNYPIYFCFIFCFFTLEGNAQVSFTDNTYLLSKPDHFSGVAMSVIDMNDDGLDDIVRQDGGRNLNIEFQTQPNQKFSGFGGIITGSSSQWSMCVADIDNNGTNEILTGGYQQGIGLAEIIEQQGVFSMSNLPEGADVFVQGTNFVDINNDGFVDVFACNDDAESNIWSNDGSGSFVPADQWIDMSIDGDSGEIASGNYGSTWADIDNDGDVDLYIAKCRQNVNDVTDKRRINQLYLNDGEGNFVEAAESRGLAVGWQSWSADFQDVNNDGWLDCFILNHDHQAQLFINDGAGFFTEISSEVNVVGLSIQVLLRDFDNDGWVDIITTGYEGQIFINNGDLTFTELPDPFDENSMESLAVGDLNGDGYLDVYGGYAKIYNRPSNINDKLWLNDGGQNNYFAVNLLGQESNRNAIGARVEIYGEWGVQIREVRAGESYGISNSLISYFGLGTADIVDSMMIRWPSGLIQKEYDLSVNSKIKVVEGQCVGSIPALSFSGPIEFCSGEDVTITTEDIYESYSWSNGVEERQVTVSNTGNYTLEAIDEIGCVSNSEIVRVVLDPQKYPSIGIQSPAEFCEGTSVVLEALDINEEEEDVFWSNGDTGYNTIIFDSGVYSVSVNGLCNDFESEQLELNRIDLPDAPTEVQGDLINVGEIAVVSAEGNNLAWYEDEFDERPFASGSSIEIEGLDITTKFYVEDRTGQGFLGNVGIKDHEGNLYTDDTSFEGLNFTAHESFTLDAVKVYTDISGLRNIVVYDQVFNEIGTALVNIEEGESTILVGIEIPNAGEYSIRTSVQQNIQTTGNVSPRLQSSDQNVEYPYRYEDIIDITGPASFTGNDYHYFYDWQISKGILCGGERVELEVVVEDPLSTNYQEIGALSVFPNPSQGVFTIEFSKGMKVGTEYSLIDLSGRIILKGEIETINELVLDIDLKSGIYIFQLANDEKVYRTKISIER